MKDKIYYKSPVGILEINTDNDKITEIKILEKEEKGFKYPDNDITSQLTRYFSGELKTFNLKVNPSGTIFQKRVWKELQKIPYGETKSYQEIAEAIGNPKAPRAVGSACNKNPILFIIPCHRVISKSGALTGFAYGLKIKEKLLKLENSL